MQKPNVFNKKSVYLFFDKIFYFPIKIKDILTKSVKTKLLSFQKKSAIINDTNKEA